MSGKKNKKSKEKANKELTKQENESGTILNDGSETENSLTDTNIETEISKDDEILKDESADVSEAAENMTDEDADVSGDSETMMDESAEISNDARNEKEISKTEPSEVTVLNKKKVIVLLLLVIVLLALIAAFVGIKSSNEKQATSEAAESADSSVTVLKVNEDDIESLSYDIGGTVYTLEKTDDKWTDPDNPDLEIDSSAVDSMLSGVQEVTSNQTISKKMTQEESTEYGFDSPIFRLEVLYSDHTANILTIGNTNSMLNLDYAIVNDNEQLITIDSSIRTAFLPTSQLVPQDKNTSDGETTSLEELLK